MQTQNKPKKKILELCNFSAGACGVWTRVFEESKRLSKLGYEVRIFSSNAIKGSEELAKKNEEICGIKVSRFCFKKLGGESFMTWDFKKEALEYSPDIIIAHNYRHIHTLKALNIKRIINEGKACKIFLVTHAPFIPDNSTRSFSAKIAVNLFDYFLGKKILNAFDKILAISNWEIPYLLKLGAEKEKILLIPNGIPEEFFKVKSQAMEQNKILFLGRISPIKNLEVLINTLNLYKDLKLNLEIVGPAEIEYKQKLMDQIRDLNLQKRVFFSKPIYGIKEKIKKIDSCKIFVLPSKKEGMPQALVEAMAREKIVLGSNIPAIREIITNNKNGYLFDSTSALDLGKKINLISKKDNAQIKKKARSSVLRFSWQKIIAKIEGIF